MLYKLVANFKFVHENWKCHIQLKANLSALLCGAVLNALRSGSNFFKSVDETLKYDHSDESYWVVISHDTVSNAVQCGPKFCCHLEILKVWLINKWRLLASSFLWCCLKPYIFQEKFNFLLKVLGSERVTIKIHQIKPLGDK